MIALLFCLKPLWAIALSTAVGGTGGFKAIPGSGWAMAELIAKGEPGPLAAAFGMERFRDGRFIDESVAAGVAH